MVIKAEAPVNIIHDNEMYGQIVVYYRAKGIVPLGGEAYPARALPRERFPIVVKLLNLRSDIGQYRKCFRR